MKSKVFILIFMIFMMLTSSVFAVNTNIPLKEVHADIYKFAEETFSLNSNVYGNVYAGADYLEILDTTCISGNLYAMADKTHLKSNVTYSSGISKDGSSSIESINSHSTIDGNAFIICDEFVLEPGSVISGDLYIIANKIDIQKSSTISGNLFAISSNLTLNGRVKQSVYATCNKFNMNYYGGISQDLHLTSENAILNSVIDRNAYIKSNSITTSADFLLYGNMEVDSHKFNFSGETYGNAIINSKELNFINTIDGQNVNCAISGNLNYSCNNKLDINNSIVLGEITSSPYVEKIDTKPAFNFKAFIVDLITFVVYVFVVSLIFKLLNKNYQNTKHEITVKNTLASFCIGLLSFIAVTIIAFVLILISFGTTLSLAILFAYLFLLFIAIPVFVLDIAILLKNKLNLYLGITLIPLALYLISSIPVLGGLVMFVVLMTGVGRIFNKVILKKC